MKHTRVAKWYLWSAAKYFVIRDTRFVEYRHFNFRDIAKNLHQYKRRYMQ